jgi:tetratricopeptide (TPR) repeat protein
MYLTRISERELKMCYAYNIGLTQLMIGKYQQALKNFEASKELKGIYPFLHDMMEICNNQSRILDANEGLNYNSSDDSLLLIRAKALFNLKGKYNYANALKDLEMIIAIDPSNMEAHIWKGKVYMDYFKLGRLTKNNTNYKKALKEFDYVISNSPTNAEAFLNRSILHRWARQYESAEQDINDALKLHPTEVELIEKGNLYFNQKKYSEAIDNYNQALQKNTNCIQAIQCRGFAKLELEKRDEAASDFFQAYYYGLMPYEYFQKYVMQRPE